MGLNNCINITYYTYKKVKNRFIYRNQQFMLLNYGMYVKIKFKYQGGVEAKSLNQGMRIESFSQSLFNTKCV